MGDSALTFAHSSSLVLPVTFRLSSLECSRPLRSPFVSVTLFSAGNALLPPFESAYRARPASTAGAGWKWDEPVSLAVPYAALPRDAVLVCTVYDLRPGGEGIEVLGGTTCPMWSAGRGTLKTGRVRLFLHPGKHGDGAPATSTPGRRRPKGDDSLEDKDEVEDLERKVKQYKKGKVPPCDWLDKLSFRQIEQRHAIVTAQSPHLFLLLDLPSFDFPVLFSPSTYQLPLLPVPSRLSPVGPSAPAPTAQQQARDAALFAVSDPEVARDNPVEGKHRRLTRSHRKGAADRELKPNAKLRDELNDILSYPPTQSLNSVQRDLLWQFRFYLTRDKRALTKFLKAVVWSDPGEVSQAVGVLLPMWTEVEMHDVLELLGPGEAFRDRRVRAWAVEALSKATDEQVGMYLLQLVQALKFEPFRPAPAPSPGGRGGGSVRASRMLSSTLSSGSGGSGSGSREDEKLPNLAEFLIDRSARNLVLGNMFRWYITVEAGDGQGEMGEMFMGVGKRFDERLKAVHASQPSSEDHSLALTRQAEFVGVLSTLARDLRLSRDARPKKIERLQAVLADPKSHLTSFAPLPLPLDARKMVVGIDPAKSSVFKSNLFPLRLNLLCSDGSEYPVIVKSGDDMRQDQLVIQLFTLMDTLLLSVNLDLKLMPYRVLATGAREGMVQFVESRTLGDVASEYGGSLAAYLREKRPDPESPSTFGIDPAVYDTYIRSCAGYCVVTYLLGVGDRHLDNLLLSPSGHFFHVDFGYILGRDPKPFPPAVKVCKEMVDAMGGVQSVHYARFKGLCYTGFINLRKSANLIINLVALMVDASIPDISNEPGEAVNKVKEKFRLDLSEEDAIKMFENLLNETSYLTSAFDRLHNLAQYWRA